MKLKIENTLNDDLYINLVACEYCEFCEAGDYEDCEEVRLSVDSGRETPPFRTNLSPEAWQKLGIRIVEED